MGLFFTSLKTKERVKTLTGLFFRSGGPLFYELENKRPNYDPEGLFFDPVDLFFMFGRVFYQIFTGLPVDLVRFFCLTRSFLLIFIIVL